jgi:protease-4
MLAYPAYAVRWILWLGGRPLRRLRRAPTWVLFLIEEAYGELPPSPRPRWQRLLRGPPKISRRDLHARFLQVAAEPRTAGVILHLRPVEMSQAQVQGYRELIADLRAAGKQVVSFAPSYTTSTYHVACACDQVLLMPGGTLNALGYTRTYMFLADALERFGLQADVLQITPYKTAMDFLSRNSMSDQAREMAEWLADAAFAELLTDVGAGRHLDPGESRAVVAASPATDQQALSLRAVDGVVYEEELGTRLGGPVMGWSSARRRLPRAAPSPPGRYVGLLRIEGTIVDGRSSRPPVGPPLPVPLLLQKRSGDLTIAQQARRLARDRRAAAVVLWVDSGGGSSTASEAMSSALAALAARKPVVAAMGSVAASGGYHVVTSARRVYAQPGTITGSIGVLAGKLTLGGLLDRLLVQREQVVRGEHAAMFGLEAPFSEEERARLRGLIEHTYEQFVDRVATARGRPRGEIEAIAGGRVWTGRQALEHGLIDELGGLERAIAHARSLAGLSPSAPLREADSGGDLAPVGGAPPTTIAYALEAAYSLNRSGTWLLCPLEFSLS